MAGESESGGGGGDRGWGGMTLPSSLGGGLGGAVSDIFGAYAQKYKRRGLALEEQGHVLAAGYARDNAKFTEIATRLKLQQENRSFFQTVGGIQAAAAGNGLAQSGSNMDILIDSATQHAIAANTMIQQGAITELGFQQQAASYDRMAEGARVATKASRTAEIGGYVSGALKGVTAIASLFTGGA